MFCRRGTSRTSCFDSPCLPIEEHGETPLAGARVLRAQVVLVDPRVVEAPEVLAHVVDAEAPASAAHPADVGPWVRGDVEPGYGRIVQRSTALTLPEVQPILLTFSAMVAYVKAGSPARTISIHQPVSRDHLRLRTSPLQGRTFSSVTT